MEAFKWEQKRNAASTKERETQKEAAREREAEARKIAMEETERKESEQRHREDMLREKELGELERLVQAQARLLHSQIPEEIVREYLGWSSEGSGARHVQSLSPSFTPNAISSSTTSTTNTNGSSKSNASELDTSPSDNSTEHNISSTSSVISSTTTDAPRTRSDTSESIYAFIIRRLDALEGNNSLVARYIEEQTRAMRLMLGRVESRWDTWKFDWEGTELSRWDIEVCCPLLAIR